MPMIDVYAPARVFDDKHVLAQRIAAAVMAIEGVPEIPTFRENTAAFIHELPADTISDVDGRSDHVRVHVLTNLSGLNRDKQMAIVAGLTVMIAGAAGNPVPPERIWVLLTEWPTAGACGAARIPTWIWSTRRVPSLRALPRQSKPPRPWGSDRMYCAEIRQPQCLPSWKSRWSAVQGVRR
jgi:hypothetical protein